jgi:hypothetical protein
MSSCAKSVDRAGLAALLALGLSAAAVPVLPRGAAANQIGRATNPTGSMAVPGATHKGFLLY